MCMCNIIIINNEMITINSNDIIINNIININDNSNINVCVMVMCVYYYY